MLSWNLFHGRAEPAAGRPLAAEFSRALAGWSWDVALLQEVPPWWPARLGAASGASARMALTSRNALLPLRRAIAARNPDLLAAAGGGCNAILVRGAAVAEHRVRELTRSPGAPRDARGRAAGRGLGGEPARFDPSARSSAAPTSCSPPRPRWSGPAAARWLFGGDLNSTQPAMPGLVHVAGHHVDHVFTEGRPAASEPEVLDAGSLSDHRPLRVAI